jgi:hypothetical protein
MIALALAAALLVSAPPAPRPDPAAAPLAAEREAFRALLAIAAGEPAIAEVQDAAERAAARAVPEARGFARRARLSALLPRFTAEYRRNENSQRIVGLQGSGEVDYLRLAPGRTIELRATWDLGALVAAPGELSAANAAAERARRCAEAVKRATSVYYERREARLALALAPPEGALARAEAELRIDRLTAELDALTGGAIVRGSR